MNHRTFFLFQIRDQDKTQHKLRTVLQLGKTEYEESVFEMCIALRVSLIGITKAQTMKIEDVHDDLE